MFKEGAEQPTDQDIDSNLDTIDGQETIQLQQERERTGFLIKAFKHPRKYFSSSKIALGLALLVPLLSTGCSRQSPSGPEVKSSMVRVLPTIQGLSREKADIFLEHQSIGSKVWYEIDQNKEFQTNLEYSAESSNMSALQYSEAVFQDYLAFLEENGYQLTFDMDVDRIHTSDEEGSADRGEGYKEVFDQNVRWTDAEHSTGFSYHYDSEKEALNLTYQDENGETQQLSAGLSSSEQGRPISKAEIMAISFELARVLADEQGKINADVATDSKDGGAETNYKKNSRGNPVFSVRGYHISEAIKIFRGKLSQEGCELVGYGLTKS